MEGFSPLVSSWFESAYGKPTPVQDGCWRALRGGSHVLATAPTGSGKTLAAFLSFIDRLVTGDLPADRLSLLYVSPLKALNADIRVNLLEPLAALRALAAERGQPFPDISVGLRSGDSTQAERRALLRRPPSILITTPESLTLMENSRSGRELLSGIRALVVDEMHALAGEKRGAFLMATVERLADRAGEFQRLGLSATVKPLEEAASWLGGLRLEGEAGAGARLLPRPVEIVDARGEKAWELGLEPAPEPSAFPRAGRADPAERGGEVFWDALADRLIAEIRENRSTLIFANARRTAEKAAFLINSCSGETLAWVHHGSLSKELRASVESRMKAGTLRAVVATSSLELGIDIGAVDEVVLLGCPGRVSQALQRLGRAGHGPGRASRGLILPLGGTDLLRCAVLREAVLEGDIEELRSPRNPLDILSQLLLGLCQEKERGEDELFDLARRSWNFRSLPRPLFASVLSFLEGKAAFPKASPAEGGLGEGRSRELRKRLWRDGEGRLSAAPGTSLALALSGGVIPDKGCYTLRLAGHGSVIGELDEEFVWERRPGEGFSLGSQRWRIVSIGDKDVEVSPLGGDITILPFWKAERQYRSPVLSRRILAVLDAVRDAPPGGLGGLCAGLLGLAPPAAEALAALILRQRTAAGLPGTSSVVAESYADPLKPTGGSELVIHTLRGSGVNYPWSLALRDAISARLGLEPEVFSDNDCVVVSLPEGHPAAAGLPSLIPGLVPPENLEPMLRRRLESSSAFGSLFRENAVRFLAVERSRSGKRVPLWLMRARAKELHARLAGREDFPITVESWRECLEDRFDMDGLRAFVRGLSEGEIAVVPASTRVPSPFCRGIIWAETAETLYRSDAARADFSSSFSEEVLRELSVSDARRPELLERTRAEFRSRSLRLLPGWAPESAREFGEFLKDRVILRREEAEEVARAGGLDPGELEASGELAGVLGGMAHPSRAGTLRGAAGDAEREGAAFARLLGEWARGRLPFPAGEVSSLFGIEPPLAARFCAEAAEEGIFVRLGEDAYCEAVTLESLYRLQRRLLRPSVEALPASALQPFLASFHGLLVPGGGEEGLRSALERLLLWPGRACDWESFLLPSRVAGYGPGLLDRVMEDGGLCLLGLSREKESADEFEGEVGLSPRARVAFVFPDQFPLLPMTGLEGLPPGRPAWSFWDLKDAWGLGMAAAVRKLLGLLLSGAAAVSSFRALRGALANGFAAAKEEASVPLGGARGRGLAPSRAERWKAGSPLPGEWFAPSEGREGADALDEDEREKEAIRLVSARHGLLFRELLERESPRLSWARLFKGMRRMELSGELLSGRFFEGIPGPQFMSPAAFQAFRGESERLSAISAAAGASPPEPDSPRANLYVIPADDPASVCGLGLPGLPPGLPSRAPGAFAVWREGDLLLSARRGGAELDFLPPPGDPSCAASAKALLEFVGRDPQRAPRLALRAVNGHDPASSPYAADLQAAGFLRGYRAFEFYFQ